MKHKNKAVWRLCILETFSDFTCSEKKYNKKNYEMTECKEK